MHWRDGADHESHTKKQNILFEPIGYKRHRRLSNDYVGTQIGNTDCRGIGYNVCMHE